MTEMRLGRVFDEDGKCAVSGKQPFKTKMAALLTNADKPIMARAYPCPHCKRWHLTRKPQR